MSRRGDPRRGDEGGGSGGSTDTFDIVWRDQDDETIVATRKAVVSKSGDIVTLKIQAPNTGASPSIATTGLWALTTYHSGLGAQESDMPEEYNSPGEVYLIATSNFGEEVIISTGSTGLLEVYTLDGNQFAGDLSGNRDWTVTWSVAEFEA